MIGDSIYTLLTDHAPLTDLVGEHVYPNIAAEAATLPWVVFHQVGRSPSQNKDRHPSVETFRVQVDIVGKNYDQAATVADLVVDALSYKSGTFAGMDVDVVVFEGEQDMHNDQTETAGKQQDFTVRIKN